MRHIFKKPEKDNSAADMKSFVICFFIVTTSVQSSVTHPEQFVWPLSGFGLTVHFNQTCQDLHYARTQRQGLVNQTRYCILQYNW